jgi:hypothetical protein
MIRLTSVIDAFETDLLAQYGSRLNADQRRALAAMKRCRNQASLKMLVRCQDCEHQKLVPHSCGNRHCPHCQHHESEQWLARQRARQLPVEYFMLTFTLPAELRSLWQSHQSTLYDLLMRAAWDTVRTFSENDKQLRGTPGAIAVLHTHTRRLDYHPHVHLVMPAGAVDIVRKRWNTKRAPGAKGGYLFSHKALAKVFRAKILAGIALAELPLPARHPVSWVVDCKSVGTGDKALVYLGRYLYRGVIAEKNIVAVKDGQVSFRYQNAKTRQMELRTVPGAQFLWLVLQHVLPKGFRRARNFGILHSNCKRLITLLHLLLKCLPPRVTDLLRKRSPIVCPCCGAVMSVVRTRLRPPLSPGAVQPEGGTM